MDDYVKQSMFTYNLMTELLDFRYKLLNPAVMTVRLLNYLYKVCK
jgi:hypothetical protein